MHGAAYVDRLATGVEQLGECDHLVFTDWRGDPDEGLRDGGATVGELFSDVARRGVCVRGLVGSAGVTRARPYDGGSIPPTDRVLSHAPQQQHA